MYVNMSSWIVVGSFKTPASPLGGLSATARRTRLAFDWYKALQKHTHVHCLRRARYPLNCYWWQEPVIAQEQVGRRLRLRHRTMSP